MSERLRKNPSDAFFAAADQLATADIPPMGLEEIQTEVNAVRSARALEERDQLRELKLEELRREIQKGIDSGEATPWCNDLQSKTLQPAISAIFDPN
jgi:hypothetical protein